jgi:predicted transcriptional regulator
MVSETIILNALLEGKHNKVEEIMSDAPPIISKEADIEVLSGLLKYFSLVAVVDKGKFIGIITRADIIEKLKK